MPKTWAVKQKLGLNFCICIWIASFTQCLKGRHCWSLPEMRFQLSLFLSAVVNIMNSCIVLRPFLDPTWPTPITWYCLSGHSLACYADQEGSPMELWHWLNDFLPSVNVIIVVWLMFLVCMVRRFGLPNIKWFAFPIFRSTCESNYIIRQNWIIWNAVVRSFSQVNCLCMHYTACCVQPWWFSAVCVLFCGA